MLVKLAKQNTNKAKENLRKVRTNAMNKLKKSKDKTSEDTIRLIEKQVLLLTDGTSVYLACVLMLGALKTECSGHLIRTISTSSLF
jgi:ribosome recycling factor